MRIFHIPDEERAIVLSETRHKELLAAEKKLQCLEAGGVDNWEWYSESLQDCGYWDDES